MRNNLLQQGSPMIKQLFVSLLMFPSLFATTIEEMEEITPLDPEVVQSLYLESALFVAVFTIMSIVSIIISKKHAAQNLLNNKEREEKEAQEALKRKHQPSTIEEFTETTRVAELSKMLNDGLISDKEFQILKNSKEYSNG